MSHGSIAISILLHVVLVCPYTAAAELNNGDRDEWSSQPKIFTM
jgi:hypothetical protein